MKPSERIEQIYKSIHHLDGHCNMNDNLDDIKWLISRVKKLTEALEFYRDGHWNGDVCNKKDLLTSTAKWHQGEIARKALEEE